MGDIFGYKRNGKAKGVLSKDNSFLTFGGSTEVEGFLVQNWNISYNQQVNEIFEIGSQNMYWVKGRPTGTGQLGRIIGPKGAATPDTFFPQAAYDICDGGAMIRLSAVGGHCASKPKGGVTFDKGISMKMDGCVVTSYGAAQTTEDFSIHENLAWRFGYLEIE